MTRARFVAGLALGLVLGLAASASGDFTGGNSLTLDKAGTTNLYIESNDGSGAAVSGATTARIRFNAGSAQWEQSIAGAAYTSFGGGGSTLQAAYTSGGSGGGVVLETTSGGPLALTAPLNAFIGALTITEANTGQTALLVTSQGTGISCPGSGAQTERFGASAVAGGSGSTVIGYHATDNTGSSNTVLGSNASAAASGTMTVIGASAAANGGNSVAIGDNSSVSNGNETVVGSGASAAGNSGIAIGQGATAGGVYSTVIGTGAVDGAANYCVVIGRVASAGATEATTVGAGSSASGSDATALGFSALAQASYSTSIGANSNDGNNIKVALLGYGSSATGVEATSLGYFASTGAASIAIGANAFVNGNNALGVGRNCTISGTEATSTGHSINDIGFSRGAYLGFACSVGGADSVLLGHQAAGLAQSVTVGSGASDAGGMSVVAGYTASADATSSQAVVLGAGTTLTSGSGSVVIGQGASSSSSVSVSIGQFSVNGGFKSVGIGWESQTGADISIALGPRAVTTATHQLVTGSLNQEITDAYGGGGFSVPATSGRYAAVTPSFTVHGSTGQFIASVSDPAGGPTVAENPAAGTFSAGTYNLSFAWTNKDGDGETLASIPNPVVTSGGDSVDVSWGAFPADVTGISIFCEDSPGSGVRYFVASSTVSAGSLTLNAPPPNTNDPEPGANTTGSSGNGFDGSLAGGTSDTASADGGSPRLRSSLTGSAGELHDRLVPSGKTTALPNNTTTTFATVTVAPGSYAGGTVHYTIFVNDGTDSQCRAGSFRFSAVNVSGSITVTVSAVDETPLAASTASTLVDTSSASTGSGLINLEMNAFSSLTPTTETITYSIETDSPSDVTPQ